MLTNSLSVKLSDFRYNKFFSDIEIMLSVRFEVDDAIVDVSFNVGSEDFKVIVYLNNRTTTCTFSPDYEEDLMLVESKITDIITNFFSIVLGLRNQELKENSRE